MIKQVECRKIINKSKLPEADYVVNPYVGCLHKCTYCYARFMKRFTGHTEPWGTFVDVKKDVSSKTIKEIDKIPPRSNILLSSVTDPYQPIEKKYRSTRSFLEGAVGKDVNISILTKSSLVERDIDLFKKLPGIKVGLSFSSHDDNVRKQFEPKTSSVQNKINTLNRLHEEDISTYAFFGPILPGITDIKTVLQMLQSTGVDLVMVESLNMRGSIYPAVMEVISKHYPDLINLYTSIKKSPKKYWESVKDEVEQLATFYNLPIMIYFDH